MGACGSKGASAAEAPAEKPPSQRKAPRYSIFGAAGAEEKSQEEDPAEKPIVNVKKDAISARAIRQSLFGNPVFHAFIENHGLTDEQISQIIDAMTIENYAENEPIVKAGEQSLDMFVIDKGQCSILDSSGNKLQGLKKGMVFGEIGFLNNTPRLATVAAERHTVCFKLNRREFDLIVEKGVEPGEISSLPIFANLSKGSIENVAKSSKKFNVTRGDVIIKKGIISDNIYVILEGTCKILPDGVTVESSNGKSDGKLMMVGSTFGELCLLNQRQPSDTVAVSDVQLLSVPRKVLVQHCPELKKKLESEARTLKRMSIKAMANGGGFAGLQTEGEVPEGGAPGPESNPDEKKKGGKRASLAVGGGKRKSVVVNSKEGDAPKTMECTSDMNCFIYQFLPFFTRPQIQDAEKQQPPPPPPGPKNKRASIAMSKGKEGAPPPPPPKNKRQSVKE